MPPKKAKAAAATKAVSSSQPEPQRPSRANGRKRRHSDGSNASEQSQASSTVVKTGAKRQKRVKAAAEPEAEVLLEADEEETGASGAEGTPSVYESSSELQAYVYTDSIGVATTTTKHVHFGSAADGQVVEKSTATNLTPHPRAKMTIKRRTLSPAASGSDSIKRIKTSRTSLPPSLSEDDTVNAFKIVQEMQFTPLRKVLEERIQRLSALRGELQVRERSDLMLDGTNEVDVLDDNMLVLDNEEEITYPQLLTGLRASSSQAFAGKVESNAQSLTETTTQGAALRRSWDVERTHFQNAILALKKEADDAKAHLQILTIELESLGFGDQDASPTVILASIRNSFAAVRDFLEIELPGTLSQDASNEAIAEILVSNVREFAERLRTADKELREKTTLIGDLGTQVHGLIDLLAEKEIDGTQLEEQWMTLERSHKLKTSQAQELNTELQVTQDERDALVLERDRGTARTEQLTIEINELRTNVERLSISLQEYQAESKKLVERITEMEDEHRATVTAMNKERETTVLELEEHLDTETAQREEARKQANERQVIIVKLESDAEALTSERDELLEELDEIKAQLDVETNEREAIEADLESKQRQVGDLEGRVSQTKEQLESLQVEITTLRQHNETERKQREAAEQDLDDRNIEVDTLDKKLHEQGKQANELRQKLFEVQSKNTETVKVLEEAMSERDLRFQDDMASEVGRREAADLLAQQRAATILTLESRLEQVEQQMRLLIIEKDKRILQLESDVSQRDVQIQNLEEELRAKEIDFESDLQDERDRIEELDGSISALQITVTEREEMIKVLQGEAVNVQNDHNVEIDNFESRIVELSNTIAEFQSQIEVLIKEKTGLERRVENEAAYLLEYQNTTQDEIDALKATIKDKQAKILNVEEKARHADNSWEEVMTARQEEIETLKTSMEAQTETITEMSAQNDGIRAEFEAYIRRASARIAHLEEQFEAYKVTIEGEAFASREDEDGMLAKLAALPRVPTVIRTTSSSQATRTSEHHALKKVRASRKKRVADSGIGVNSDEIGEAS